MSDMEEIRGLMGRARLNQTQFAKELGVSQGTVSKWLNGAPLENASRAKIEAFKRRRFPGEAEVSRVVKVMGRIGAGSVIEPDVEQVPPEGLFEWSVPFDLPPGIIGFEVQGESMWPRYEGGDVVLCYEAGTDPSLLLHREAAVRTEDGRRYLKQVEEGGKRGTFILTSHNAKPIPNVRIEWASRIFGVAKAFR